MLKYLRQNNCPWDYWTTRYAAYYGHMEVLQWAIANGCPTTGAIGWAVKAGHLEMVKWMISNGILWEQDVCVMATSTNQIEVLKWAIDNGCCWNEKALILAVSFGRLEILKLFEKWVPWNKPKNNMLKEIAKFHKRTQIVQWLENRPISS